MSDAYLGEIRMVANNFAPLNWAYCDGQLIKINQNTALFSLIGTTFGGDGTTTFAVPDFRGRVPVHKGAGIDRQTGRYLTNKEMGEAGGLENVPLSVDQLANHTHTGGVSGLKCSTPVNQSPAGYNKPDLEGNSVLGAANSGGRDINIYNSEEPTGSLFKSEAEGSLTINNTGGNAPHYNMQPYLTVAFCIVLGGTYPPRGQ